MCNVAAIGLGLQGAGLIAGLKSNKQEQESYNNYQILSTQAALTNYIQQAKQVNLRYAQEMEASDTQREQIRIENMKAKATAQASAAASGVEGLSIDNLFMGYDRATAVSNYTHARNLQMLGLEFNNQLDTYRIQAINSINTMQQYNGASTSSTLLSGIGGLLSSYAKNYKSSGVAKRVAGNSKSSSNLWSGSTLARESFV